MIFIHVPRTGGTSVNQYFEENGLFGEHNLNVKDFNFHIMYGIFKSEGQTFELDHLDYKGLQSFLPKNVLSTYKKFGIVRDPAKRLLSDFKRIKQRKDRRLFDAQFMDFDDFVLNIAKLFDKGLGEVGHFKKSHLLPQLDFIPNEKNIEILRFENLQNDWRKFVLENNLPIKDLPHKNKTTKPPSESEYKISAKSLSIIKEIYRKDYQEYGY